MMNTKFSVGELAKLSNVSKQTLIFYDKNDVFKPKIVDAENGYRYYTADQLEVLDSILILKEMGLSLKEIKTFMANRNSDNAINLMKNQHKKIKEKIRELKLIEQRLELKIKTLENFSLDQDNIIIKHVLQPEYMVTEIVKQPKTLLQFDIALKKLLDKAHKFNFYHFYQVGAMIPVENLHNNKFTNADFAFLPLSGKQSNIEIHEKPKGIYAQIFHKGAYDKIGDTYKMLLNEIDKKGYKIVGYSYEYCVLDSLTTMKNNEYITEIQIKVEKNDIQEEK